jgi:hypothetical protein
LSENSEKIESIRERPVQSEKNTPEALYLPPMFAGWDASLQQKINFRSLEHTGYSNRYPS